MNFEEKDSLLGQHLEEWVMDKCDTWRNHYESNYQEKHQEYYRLWRGIWDASDVMRASERSRIIAPALQQAVESAAAEVEEATFGRGKWFDLKDDRNDPEAEDIMYLRETMLEDFDYCKVRRAVSEVILNSAVFGTGVAEIVMDEVLDYKPATQPVMGGQAQAYGVETKDRTVVKMRPILPQNFLIDPNACSIEEALGVAIDEYVPMHFVETMQEKGVYMDVEVGTDAPETDLEPDQDLLIYSDDKVRLTKYYGLVPTHLFDDAMLAEDEEVVELGESEEKSKYTEAVVVIANGGTLLKVEETPYMMQDRPVVAFSWDIVPSRFWGRGVCEKGYNSQKALDTELRARIDALALTVHPMMAVDASRLPRGVKMEIRPGKTILTNGNPAEILQPFKFGNLDPNTFNQAAALQTMVQQATGAIDSAGLAGQVNGEATAAGISMGLGAIIKRHKRTLINFQDNFLIPFVRKAAWRYMQFDPERYPVKDYKFNASSSLGIIAREYEVTQLVQLLQTMSPDSPLYSALIESIVDNMNLSNREELITALQKAGEPDPQQQQMQQAQAEAQMRMQAAQTSAFEQQAAEFAARANKANEEARVTVYKAETDRIKSMPTEEKEDVDEKEFQRRSRLAELMLKEKEVDLKARAEEMRMRQAQQSKSTEDELMKRLGG